MAVINSLILGGTAGLLSGHLNRSLSWSVAVGVIAATTATRCISFASAHFGNGQMKNRT